MEAIDYSQYVASFIMHIGIPLALASFMAFIYRDGYT